MKMVAYAESNLWRRWEYRVWTLGIKDQSISWDKYGLGIFGVDKEANFALLKRNDLMWLSSSKTSSRFMRSHTQVYFIQLLLSPKCCCGATLPPTGGTGIHINDVNFTILFNVCVDWILQPWECAVVAFFSRPVSSSCDVVTCHLRPQASIWW